MVLDHNMISKIIELSFMQIYFIYKDYILFIYSRVLLNNTSLLLLYAYLTKFYFRYFCLIRDINSGYKHYNHVMDYSLSYKIMN
jgi:hypothetical protein